MTTEFSRGFTIIEVMLFFGVSAALFAALLIGVNGNITQQQYKDGVLSYSTSLQDQYSQVANTQNERSDNWVCNSGDVNQQPAGGDARGTSSCVILGRAIQIGANGSTIQTSSVVGSEPASLDANASDLTALVAYQPKVSSSFDTETTQLDWGSSLITTDRRASTASFLVLRSPVSGLIRVFASNSALPAVLSQAITQDAATTIVTNCVSGNSGLLPTQSVSVDPSVAGPGGVSVKELDPLCS